MEEIRRMATAADCGFKLREQAAYRSDQEEVDRRHEQRKAMIQARRARNKSLEQA